MPICRQFDPEFVLISAGFDAQVRDPLGGLQVTEEGFGAMARALLRIACDHAIRRSEQGQLPGLILSMRSFVTTNILPPNI